MSAPHPAENEEPPTQGEMAQGHLFEFTWQSWGVSRVVGDPTYTQADWSLPLHPVRVRAWSLREALVKAADLPLSAWFPEEDRPHHYLRGDDCSCGFAAGLGAVCTCPIPPGSCGAATEHEVMRTREYLTVCPICNLDLSRVIPPGEDADR